MFVLEIVSQPYASRHVNQFSPTVQQSEREGSCLVLHRDAGEALNTAEVTEQDVPVDEYTFVTVTYNLDHLRHFTVAGGLE